MSLAIAGYFPHLPIDHHEPVIGLARLNPAEDTAVSRFTPKREACRYCVEATRKRGYSARCERHDLERNERQRNRTTRTGAARGGRPGRNRKYPPAQVADIIGGRTVIAITPRDATRNESVLAECPKGHRAVVYVFNLRRGAECRICRKKAKP